MPIILLTLLIRLEDHGIIILTQGKLTELPIYENAHESVFSCAFCVFYQHFDTKSPKTCLPDVQVVSDLGDPSRCGLKQKI